MARIANTIRVFSSQSVTSSGTLTSDAFDIQRSAYSSIHYVLSTATTGVYVAATARILLAANDRETYLQPVDSDGTDVGTLMSVIDSNNRIVQNSIPMAPRAKLEIKSSTANTITFDAVYLTLDESN